MPLNKDGEILMTDPIRQQLIAARKDQILDAAAVVFARKGFHPTTTRDIAKQANIAEGTIYNYFESKSALLLGIFDRMREKVVQETIPPTLDELDLRAFVGLFLQQPLMALKGDNFALFRIVVSEMLVNEELRLLYYQKIIEPTLALAEPYLEKQAQVWGKSREEMQLTLRIISATLSGLMLEYILGDPTLVSQWEKVPDALTELIVNGLAHPASATPSSTIDTI